MARGGGPRGGGGVEGLDARLLFGIVIVGLALVLAVFAPWFAGSDPTAQGDVVATRFLRPWSTDPFGVFHLLGTDRFGRDVWARLLYGARVSLGVGVLAMALSVLIGTVVGAVAGMGTKPVRDLLLGATDFALALPRVVLLLLLASLWEPSAVLVILVLGLTGWMSIARLVFSQVRSLRARPFIEAATALGAKPRTLLRRHVIPNALTPVIIAATLGVGNTILLEAGLSFLGLGVQPPTPSWGNMIASGRDTLVNAPWVAVVPGIALVLVVVALTQLGDVLQERGN